MQYLKPIRQAGLAAACLCIMNAGAWAVDPPIAGLEPSMRPAGAPVITTYHKDAAWYRYALTGISQPYPASLRFLEDQGAWHNPFVRPGMTGRYDIRNWHGPASGEASQAAEKR